MLATKDGHFQADQEEYLWENEHYIFYGKGFLYILGVKSGVPSLKKFAGQIHKVGLVPAVSDLKGHFFLVVKDKKENSLYAFTDHSGAFHAYYTQHSLSDSFLQLTQFHRFTKGDLCKESVVEFMNFGTVFGGKTLLSGIRKICSEEIIRLNRKGLSKLGKQLPGIDQPHIPLDFMEFFRQFSESIRNRQVSIDLTGGIDSRLLVVLLDHYGIPYELTISGTDSIQDVKISREVAELLGHSVHVTYPYIDHLEQQVPHLFAISDGQHDIFKHYRTMLHNQNRLNRKKDLVITGVGGEFFKDSEWLHDFPFYASKKTNLERLINLRIVPKQVNDAFFSGGYYEASIRLKSRIKEELLRYRLETNTQSYDNIYYHYELRSTAGNYITAANRMISCYAPLLERDVVRYGFHLPRTERFFNGFHRKVMTQLHPQVAKVKTTEGGISASARHGEVMCDIQKYFANKTVRLARLIGKKYWGKTYFQETPEHPQLFHKIRSLPCTGRAFLLLKEEGLLHPDLGWKEIGDSLMGNMVTLALFLDFMHDEQIPMRLAYAEGK